MIKYISVILISIFIPKFVFADNLVKKPLKFGRNENSAEQDVASIVFKKISESIGIAVEIEAFPPARANAFMLSNKISGEIARVRQYGKMNPNIIRVDPAYYKFTTNGYCLKSRKIRIHSYEDLKKYSVAVIRGVIHSSIATQGHKDVHLVSNGIQMFDLVNSKRIDIAIDNGINGERMLLSGKYENIENCGVAASLDLHLYLNSSAAKYEKIYSEAFIRAKKNHSLEKMIREAESKILSKDFKIATEFPFGNLINTN